MFKSVIFVCMGVVFLLTACSRIDKIAEDIAAKNLSGNGTFISNRIGVDTESRIPGLETTFISGDMASVRAGTNAVSYREESSSSIWNAESITKKRFLSITLTDQGNIPQAIQAISEVLQNVKSEQTNQK